MANIEGSFAPLPHTRNMDRPGDHQYDGKFPIGLSLSLGTVRRPNARNDEYVFFRVVIIFTDGAQYYISMGFLCFFNVRICRL